jgi:hypothetical protein
MKVEEGGHPYDCGGRRFFEELSIGRLTDAIEERLNRQAPSSEKQQHSPFIHKAF